MPDINAIARRYSAIQHRGQAGDCDLQFSKQRKRGEPPTLVPPPPVRANGKPEQAQSCEQRARHNRDCAGEQQGADRGSDGNDDAGVTPADKDAIEAAVAIAAAEGNDTVPIILDLDSNGIKARNLSRVTVFMDAANDDLTHRLAWLGAGRAFVWARRQDQVGLVRQGAYDDRLMLAGIAGARIARRASGKSLRIMRVQPVATSC